MTVSHCPIHGSNATGANGAPGTAAAGDAMKEESDAKPSTPSGLEGRLSSGGATSVAATTSFDWAAIKVPIPAYHLPCSFVH